MKKGFTLIELLAVIVIMGIIATILVPKINNELTESRKKVSKAQVELYMKAIDQFKVEQKLEGNNINLDGKYIVSNGNLGEYTLKINGKKPNGTLKYKENKIIKGCLTINGYAVIIEEDEIKSIEKNSCNAYARTIQEYDIPELVTTGDGLYESKLKPGRYVYRGADPDNRIYLKEDETTEVLYRIISFEADGTIKVIRDERLSSQYVWDKQNVRKTDGTNNTFCQSTSCNIWGNQTNTLYNGTSLGANFHFKYYENETSSTLVSGKSGSVTTDSTLNKFLNHTEDDSYWTPLDTLSNYIVDHKFNVGGIYNRNSLEIAKKEESLYTWTGKVGLMTVTEWAEASLSTECTKISTSSASGTECKDLNWQHKTHVQWTITPSLTSSNNSGVYMLTNGYCSTAYSAANAGYIRPTFYLKANIKLEGKGTEQNPYRIAS